MKDILYTTPDLNAHLSLDERRGEIRDLILESMADAVRDVIRRPDIRDELRRIAAASADPVTPESLVVRAAMRGVDLRLEEVI